MKLCRTVLDPRRLRLLVLLEGLGTVRGVAERAAMSPSAVSQQLAKLEREAGVGLLERRGRAVALTGAGVALAAHGREILERIAAAEEALASRRGSLSGTVTVAAFTSAMRAFAIEAAAAVRAEHAELAVHVAELGPAACIAALERGEADLAVVGDFGDGELASAPWLETVSLVADELLAVLPVGHPAADGPVALPTLRDDPWVVDGTELEHWLVRACRRAGFEPRVTSRLFAHESLLHAVRTGLGVTVLPAMALLDAAGVAVVPLNPPSTRELSVLHRRDATERRAVAVTLDALRTAADASDGSRR